MIITVTANPALDKTAELDTLAVGGLNRLRSVTVDAGGKGVNVSKMVAALGGASIATGFAGGGSGAELLDRLSKMSIRHDFITVADTTRTNLKVLAADSGVTELNEPGAIVTAEEIDALLGKLLAYSGPDTLVVISGSIPRGAEPTMYRDLTRALRDKGARVFADADGAVFRHALDAPPNFIKPNREELAAHFNVPVNTDIAGWHALCKRLLETGVELVALSMGADGALFVTNEAAVYAPGLPVKASSTVGAGDSMVGALAWAIERSLPLEEAITLSMAASAGAVTTTGTNPPELALVSQLKQQVRLEYL